MDDQHTVPALPPPSAPPPAGGKRATLALLVALAALGIAVQGLAHRVFDEQSVASSSPALENVEARLQSLEERHGRFAEDMAKISAKLEEVGKAPVAAADISKGVVEELHQKIDALEKENAAIRTDMEAALQQKARLLSDVGLVQAVRHKIQQGMDFSRERKQLGDDVHALPVAADSLKMVDTASHPATLADQALRDDLRALAPSFAALGKMEKTVGFVEKLKLRLQNLVTIRPRDGMAQDGSESGKALAALEGAVVAHDWKNALVLAEALKAKAPPEFAPWLDRLKTRAGAEGGLDNLEQALLGSLRSEKKEAPTEAPADKDENTP